MSHLSKIYAKSLDVKVGEPILQPHFFPLLQEKYITIHTSDKCPSKNYSYWSDVVKILKPELEKRDIAIIQVGTNADPLIEGVNLFLNNLSFKQSSYILSKTLCHVGIDSSPVHISSALKRPTVSVYAHCYASMAGPLWNQDKAIVVESDRGGKKPSFSNHEDPKEIDRIKPEEIAESVFKLLGIGKANSQKTIFIGRRYLDKTIDIIPSENPKDVNVNDAKVRVRMDLHFNEPVLQNILRYTNGQIEILTGRVLDKDLISMFKGRISRIVYESKTFEGEFLEFLRKSGIPFTLNCLDEKTLSDQRLKYFHYEINQSNRLEEAEKLMEENKDLPDDLKFNSNRIYVEGQKVFTTLCKEIGDLQFWIDAKYFRVYQDYSFC